MIKLLLLLISTLFISCVAYHTNSNIYNLPGFWLGLWHGTIAPITFIISLFSDIKIYAFPNLGKWYDFGFMLGIGGFTVFTKRLF
jgi:hypothetical protein